MMTDTQENMLLYFLGNGITPVPATNGLFDICTGRSVCGDCPFFKIICKRDENFITSEDLEKFLEKCPEYKIIL